MPVLPEFTTPKGNVNMTLFGTRNDDTTVSLPELPFYFPYNGSVFNIIYSSGNSWIGFGSAAEHLQINRRDASYNNLYYSVEPALSEQSFRIRFEGNAQYNYWGSNNLVWEFTVFESGIFQLVMEATPRNGTDAFSNPGGVSGTLTFEAGKSYVFVPQRADGIQYEVIPGSYYPSRSKFLIVDNEGVKACPNQGEAWELVGEPPITEEMFLAHGSDYLPNHLNGLQNEATLHFYTDDPKVLDDIGAYVLEVKEIVTSKPKLLLQTEDFEILRPVEAMELRAKLNGGRIMAALSVDGGSSFLTYTEENGYEKIDIRDSNAFLQHGIAPEKFTRLDCMVLNTLLTDKLRFAYILDKPHLSDICKLKAVKITYEG